MTQTRRVALEPLHRRLTEYGFKQPKKNLLVYLLPLREENAQGWLALNVASKHTTPGTFEVNPIVGVLRLDVRQLVADLLGEGPKLEDGPTISSPLGYLMDPPKYRAWFFDSAQAESGRSASDLMQEIETVAVHFMRDHATLQAVLDGVEQRLGTNLEFQRPAILLLLGRTDAAIDFVEKTVASMEGRTDLAAARYRIFAENLASAAIPEH